MADVGKTSQSKPGATTLTDLYTCPALTMAAIRITACNEAGAATTIRISIAPLGAADATSQYIAYDLPLDANNVYETSVKVLTATDKIRVYSGSGNVNFTANGIETT